MENLFDDIVNLEREKEKLESRVILRFREIAERVFGGATAEGCGKESGDYYASPFDWALMEFQSRDREQEIVFEMAVDGLHKDILADLKRNGSVLAESVSIRHVMDNPDEAARIIIEAAGSHDAPMM